MRRWLLALLLVGCALPTGADAAQELDLFVPCGMIVPFNRAKMDFEKRTGMKVNITYDNAVMLVRRIREKGERPDILVTPGEVETNQMSREGFLDKPTITTFGTFKLILVVPARSRAGVQSLDDLTKPEVRRIILADPKLNSVGYYSQVALQRSKLWDKVKGKVLTHWHALEAVNLLCKGRVDAGLYYASCPFDSAPEKMAGQKYRIVCDLPQDIYPPVKVQAATLKAAKHKPAAAKFLKFLMEPATQQKLAASGIPNFGAKAASTENGAR